MSVNQLHGKRFEDFIKGCGLFPGASDHGRGPTSGFDIEARFDQQRGLPTSIKTTGSAIVALSDARRFFATPGPYRMIVGRYAQKGDRKEFSTVHEFILSQVSLDALTGELPHSDVEKFHNGLLLNVFPLGRHHDARAWASACKSELSERVTKIILNPKIGSDSQRRLQCSVNLASLIDATSVSGDYVCHTEHIGDFDLPIIQRSTPRQR